MRANFLATLLYASAAAAVALPQSTPEAAPEQIPESASSDPSVALGQLAQLNAFVASNITEALGGNTTTKRGACTLSTLRIRRNWYVNVNLMGFPHAESRTQIRA